MTTNFKNMCCSRWIVVAMGIVLLSVAAWSLPPDGSAGPTWLRAIGRFHPLIVHMPIAFALLVPVLDILGRWRRRPEWSASADLVLGIALMSAVMAVLMGLALGHSDEHQGDTVQLHLWMGYAATVALGVAWALRPQWPALAVPSVVVACALVGFTGHIGGELTHGSTYLTENLPEPIARLMGAKTPQRTSTSVESTVHATSTSITSASIPAPSVSPVAEVPASATVWDAVIAPLLNRSCVSCHSATVHKGGLRLDAHTYLVTGSDAVVVAGNPESSELLRRVLLPIDDDEFMPQNHKKSWDETEVSIVRWWISAGADAQLSIDRAAMDAPENVKTFLRTQVSQSSSVIKNLAPVSAPTPILTPKLAPAPTTMIEPVDPIDISWQARWSALHAVATEAHVELLPVSTHPEDGLTIRAFSGGKNVTDASFARLMELAPWVVDIDVAGTAVGDSTMAMLATWPSLRRLDVSRTAITHTSAASFARMRSLHCLLMNGTVFDDVGMEELGHCSQLRTLALCQTKVSTAALQALRVALPQCGIGSDEIPNDKK